MRRFVPAILLALALPACQGKGGAVSVRWRLRDLTTGEQFKPRLVGGPDGVCVHQDPSWCVEKVRIVMADPVTRNEMTLPRGDVEFPCSKREGTTPFSLPLGEFAISIAPITSDVPVPGAFSPAPQVRTTRAGEIVNLDIVEIGVHPLPLGSADGGTPDAGSDSCPRT